MIPRAFLTSLTVALCIGLLALAPARAAVDESIDEGIDYSLVPAPERLEPGNDVEVVEVFWYGCPHCYHLEPAIEKWLEHKPEGVTFRRMPGAVSPNWVPHAKAFYAAKMLGVLDKFHEPLFKAIHEQKRRIFTDEQIIRFAAEQGIDEDAFRNAFNSFPVDMQVRKAADLAKHYNIDGVPAMVVDGKYVTSVSQTGSTERMFDVIDYLVAKEQDGGSKQAQASAGEH